MAFKSAKIIGDGTAQSAVVNSLTLESVINSLVAYNATSTEASFSLLIDGAIVVTEKVPANGNFRIPDKLNLPVNTTLTVNASAGVDVTISYFQQAIDTAAALTVIQSTLQDAVDAAAASAILAENALPSGTIDDDNPALDKAYSSAKIEAELALKATGSGSPTGTVIHLATLTVPEGYLKADGQAVSRATFNELFLAIGEVYGVGDGSTTFNLPDLRGVFVRSYDDGASVDTGRSFGSTQDDENKEHSHTGAADSSGNHSHTGSTASAGNHTHLTVQSSGTSGSSLTANQFSRDYDEYAQGRMTAAGAHTHSLTIDNSGDHTHNLSIENSGGTESRPKNIALLACIKY